MTSIRVPMDRLYPGPGNRPDGSGDTDLEAMAATIKVLGVLQLPLAEPIPGKTGCYRIKDGHRRYAAAELAGLTEMEVEVRQFGPHPPEVSGALTAIITTLHRSPHGAVELALKFAALTEAGMTPNDIARVTALPRSTVYSYLKLAKADRATLDAARRGDLSIGSVRAAVTAAATMRPGDAPVTVRPARRARAAKPVPPGYFGASHPLAVPARAGCLHAQHPPRSRYGQVACGACWEEAIRGDERQRTTRPLPGGWDERPGPGPDDSWDNPGLICGAGP